MKRLTIVTFTLLLLILGGTRTQHQLAFTNGQIHTLNAENDVVEAMLVEAGRITALGSTAYISSLTDSNTQVVDLQEGVLLPGFVDAHSHFPASGIRAISVDLSPSPIGETDSVAVLMSKIQRAAEAQPNKKSWILGYNYDNTSLGNGQHPTRAQLDSVVSTQPVYLWHSSGHMGVANSMALEALSINEGSVAPFGGHYGVDPLTGKLNGLLQEKAAPPLSRIIKQYSVKQQLQVLTEARDEYLAAGVTTVQNGFAGKNQMRVLRLAQWLGLLHQRVVVWPAHHKKAVEHDPLHKRPKRFTFHKGAVKILVDGSPQGMTAYLTQPYYKPPNNNDRYRGFALIEQAELTRLVTDYHRIGYQLALHGNGDAAMDYIINAVSAAQADHPRADARHIIVHAQTIRKDQIEKLKELSITPSFFNSHTFYWGDWHRTQSLGPDRSNNISPTRWALDAGLKISLHSDAPVTPMDPMQLLWSATKRETTTGFVLGAEQRIDTQSALRALTIDAAWQNHLDGQIGSFEIGKLADAVLLSHSPFEVDDVREIQVQATYIGGIKRFDKKP